MVGQSTGKEPCGTISIVMFECWDDLDLTWLGGGRETSEYFWILFRAPYNPKRLSSLIDYQSNFSAKNIGNMTNISLQKIVS